MLIKLVTHINKNIFVYCLILLSLLKFGTIQMEATPYGDGRRIVVWLSYLQETADGFSYWMPFRNGGMPLFADPEHFWALMPFIDTSSSYANLQLNILLFIYCNAPFFPAWIIAKRIGMAPLWAGVAALFVSFNGYMIITEQSARFASFINFTTLLVILAILLKPRKNLTDYLAITILIGACLCVAFQYTLFHIFLVYSYLLFSEEKTTSKVAHFFNASLITGLIGIIAVMLAMVFILPVFGHLFETNTSQGQFYLPNVKNGFESFLGLVFPFTMDGDPVFVCLIIVPAIILAFKFGVKEHIKSFMKGLSFPIFFCFLFFLMTLPFIGSPISTLFANIPVISTIRQLSYVLGFASIMLPLFAMGMFSLVHKKQINEIGLMNRIVLSIYFLICALMALYFGLGKQYLFSDISVIIASFLLLLVSTFMIFPTHFMCRIFNPNQTLGKLGLVLVFISILFLAPSAFYEFRPDRPNLKLHVKNDRPYKKFSHLVSEYPDQYSKVLASGSGTQLGFMYSQNRTLSGFSTYMPKSFPYIMSYLNTSIDWNTQRPHWVKRITCNQFDENALSMMHVNYLICVKNRIKSDLPNAFEVVETQGRLVLLKRTNESIQSLRVFCRHRSIRDIGPNQIREEVLNSFLKAELLFPESGFKIQEDTNCPKDGFADATVSIIFDMPDEIMLEVRSEHSGTLVIPDNFNLGWQAEVNGVAQPIIRAFFAFRGIQVHAGQSVVHLKYRDQFFELGLLISGVTLALLLLVWIASFIGNFKSHIQD